MTNFVRTRDRGPFVNLDHVAKAEWNGHDGYDLLSSRGEILGVVTDGEDAVLDRIILPAAPGIYATVIGSYHSNARPTEDDIYVERVPVVAWMIDVFGEHPAAMPVIAGMVSGDAHVLIERPDGRLDDVASALYDDLDKAKADILDSTQNYWDMNKRLREEKAAKAKSGL